MKWIKFKMMYDIIKMLECLTNSLYLKKTQHFMFLMLITLIRMLNTCNTNGDVITIELMLFAESILCRILACSQHYSPSARLDIVRHKFREIKADKMLLEEEYTDRIETHSEHFHTNSTEFTACFEENQGENMYLETYSLNNSELQATTGKTQIHIKFSI